MGRERLKRVAHVAVKACSVPLYGAFVALCLNGCSLRASLQGADHSWLPDGSLVISRPVPQRTTSRVNNTESEPMRSRETDIETASIVISRKDRTLTALRPGSAPVIIKTEGAQHLSSGSFSITTKEESPLWYAPREYYTNRSLRIPPEGSRERFKRAALGSRALYLNDQTPIHSGPVWMKEIGGVRLATDQMDYIFSSVSVGTRVEIR